MMAEAIDWDDSATVSREPMPADETWHVAVAPDDVKVVSLEQLDDMFRLSLVDSETKVWQPGMSEWVSLGVVAGLDPVPTPPTRRAHPKPPSPRSAPPPPQRAPAAVVAAPFYTEPLAPASYAPTQAPVKYALPPVPSLAPIASVRPLVVSHNPYPLPRKGGGFGRFIVGVALLTGAGITLYRNDVLRDLAHAAHQDGLYAQLEQRLGGPGFGTLHAVEQSAGNRAAAALTLGGEESAPAANTAAALASAVAAPTPPLSPTAAPSIGGSPPVVSLESLGTEKKGAAIAKQPDAAPAPPPKAASIVSAPVAKAAPVTAKALAPAPVKAAPVEKPAPPPVATKPESEMTPRERLNAEIARSMSASASSSKKSSKSSTGLKGSSEYDPLNSKL
jgi:hypothetical protein